MIDVKTRWDSQRQCTELNAMWSDGIMQRTLVHWIPCMSPSVLGVPDDEVRFQLIGFLEHILADLRIDPKTRKLEELNRTLAAKLQAAQHKIDSVKFIVE